MTMQESDKVTRTITLFRQGEIRIPRSVLMFKTGWYSEVVGGLETSAIEFLRSHGIKDEAMEVVDVPGSYELPFAIDSVFSTNLRPDMALALGCVVRGETPHFDFVCNVVASGVSELSIKHKTPVGFGVLTVDSLEQALARKSKGAEAAHAALAMFNLQKSVKGYF
jgi:6,7-dimethyl-8-ribityllumazine synthase